MNDENEQPLERAIRRAAKTIAGAITPTDAAGGLDPDGHYVNSLTEAVMGMTGALGRIADALLDCADAIRGRAPDETGQ